MVNGYSRGQSDLRALSLLEELKVCRTQTLLSHHQNSMFYFNKTTKLQSSRSKLNVCPKKTNSSAEECVLNIIFHLSENYQQYNLRGQQFSNNAYPLGSM